MGHLAYRLKVIYFFRRSFFPVCFGHIKINLYKQSIHLMSVTLVIKQNYLYPGIYLNIKKHKNNVIYGKLICYDCGGAIYYSINANSILIVQCCFQYTCIIDSLHVIHLCNIHV